VILSKAHFGSLDHFRLGNLGVIDASTLRKVRGSILTIDIDKRSGLSFYRLAGRLRAFRNELRPRNIAYSRTNKGWHIEIETRKKLKIPERIAIQCILGSDPKREALNMYRWLCVKGRWGKLDQYWKDRLILLFREKLL
jgi:hypothetical protein